MNPPIGSVELRRRQGWRNGGAGMSGVPLPKSPSAGCIEPKDTLNKSVIHDACEIV